ncbi:DNA alkylation repair protein [Actibacterium sp.]|uniref:DNA alkylation repair protein n=1 Tax=Actibacterium sp. TaxID=1872125 RepID=UPI003561B299
MTADQALEALHALAVPGRADGAKAYHKAARVYLGVPNPEINDLTKEWRQSLDVDQRVDLARGAGHYLAMDQTEPPQARRS